MRPFDFCRLATFSILLAAPLGTGVSADASYDKITAVMKTKGSMHNNRLGALVGARAYCQLDYEPLLQNWTNRYGMNSKTPQVIWDQMIAVAKSTISDLETDNANCSEEAKQSLMSRVE